MKMKAKIWEIYIPKKNMPIVGYRFTLESKNGTFIASGWYSTRRSCKNGAETFCENHNLEISSVEFDDRSNSEFLA